MTPQAAYSLRYNAPQLEAMNAFVEQVDHAGKKIDKLPVSKAEKRHLIRAAMRKAAANWQNKLKSMKTQ